MPDEYNQRELPPDLDEPLFEGFSEVLRPGDRAIDGVLVDARTGAETSLSALWQAGPVVLEFGSFSCPSCVLASPDMEALARDLAPRGAQGVFVYVREAHPGEKRPAHRTMQDKLAAARAMIAGWGLARPVFADALDGALHRHYGLLPHMAWVIDRGGRVAYKASWADPRTLRMAAEQVLYEEGLGDALEPYEVEWQPRRKVDETLVLERLAESGDGAVRQYLDAVRAERGEAAARPLEAWWDARRGRQ